MMSCSRNRKVSLGLALSLSTIVLSWLSSNLPAQELAADKANLESYQLPKVNVQPNDWPQWGGTSLRNNAPVGMNIPDRWDVETKHNIKWSAELGSQAWSSPVVANGKIFIGTNNNHGYLQQLPGDIDLGCLLCFDEKTGEFLWQHSSEKLATGRVQDWPFQGITNTPVVDGERLWLVTNRAEVVCLDAQGFLLDHENDGPYLDETIDELGPQDADVVWKLDLIGQLGVSPHNMSKCSLTCAGDYLFVVTSNGLDESHINFPAPEAPAFVTLNRNTGEVLWTDNSSGKNVLHTSWSSPAYAVLAGQPQVLFPGGDGWLYSFDPAGNGAGHSKLLWKFDCNPKTSKHVMGGRGTRNECITIPVIYNQRVYVAMGQDPEHGEGPGVLWCIDPTKKTDGSDVSPTLAFDANGKPLAPRRIQAVEPEARETERPNPNSAVVWQFEQFDLDRDRSVSDEEKMHRSTGSVSIKDDLLFIADFSGFVHCLDARTGKVHWNHNLLSASYLASPLIVDGKVYVTEEEGEITIFALSAEKKVLNEIDMRESVYTSPIVANNTLYIATKSKLYAISN